MSRRARRVGDGRATMEAVTQRLRIGRQQSPVRSPVDATISRVRMRDLTRSGRFRLDADRSTALRRACASRRKSGTEASGIATTLPSRPGAVSPRSGGGDPVAAIRS